MGKFLGTLAIIGLGVLLYSKYKKLEKEKKAKLKELENRRYIYKDKNLN